MAATTMDFEAMPKLELHAHLSGSITPQCLHSIWAAKIAAGDKEAAALDDPLTVISGSGGFDLTTFFPLFGKYIYTLINTAEAIKQSTLDVLKNFESDGVVYLELRTTPRAIPSAGITAATYVSLVLSTISTFNSQSPSMVTKLILSIDRRSSPADADYIFDLALRHRGPIVGLDLCGDPSLHDISIFRPIFSRAKKAGLGITLHFGEVARPPTAGELEELMAWGPGRVGHVIYVSEDIKRGIVRGKVGLELCLSCNVRLGMMGEGRGYMDHHFGEWRGMGCPIVLCTDDVGIVGSPVSNEYRLVAEYFKMSEEEIKALASSGIEAIFGGEAEKQRLRRLMW